MKKIVLLFLGILIISLSSIVAYQFIDYINSKENTIISIDEVVGDENIETSETTTEDENMKISETIIVEDNSIEGKYDHNEILQNIIEVSKRYGAIGVSTALIENGKIIDTFSYGSAIKGELSMTEDTKVRIASISKVFVGLATMISVENGTMNLDEDISAYWGFKMGTHSNGDVITPRTILTHTSSIYNTEDVPATYYNAMANRLKGSGIRSIVSGNIQNYYYNNYAIDVLGMTIELANNKILDNILSERIYNPLGIDAAFYAGDVKDTSNIATLYYPGGNVAVSASKMKNWHNKGPGAVGWGFAGGVTISAKDLGKIIALISNNGIYDGTRYLKEESIRNLEYHEGNYTGQYYQCQPLHYKTDEYGQEEFYYHTGYAYGVLSIAGYNPITKQGVAIITTGASNGNILGDLTEILLNIEV